MSAVRSGWLQMRYGHTMLRPLSALSASPVEDPSRPTLRMERLMRTIERPRHVGSFMFAFAATLAMACASDVPTQATQSEYATAAARKGDAGAAAYTVTNLGALPGDNSSRANAVNDAGEVVGYSCCASGNRAFIRLSGILTALPGGGNALAISNGSIRHVVGWAGPTSLPVKWTVVDGTPGAPAILNVGAATWGAARGVNDAGAAVGNAGNEAAMWDAAGNLTIVPTPQGFVRGEGRGIDNEGHAVFVFSRPDAGWPNGIAIGYLRLATGELMPLPANAANGISYANGLSAVNGGAVQVAGSIYASASTPTAVRWTVNVVSMQIVSTEVRSEISHAVG